MVQEFIILFCISVCFLYYFDFSLSKNLHCCVSEEQISIHPPPLVQVWGGSFFCQSLFVRCRYHKESLIIYEVLFLGKQAQNHINLKEQCESVHWNVQTKTDSLWLVFLTAWNLIYTCHFKKTHISNYGTNLTPYSRNAYRSMLLYSN